MENQDEVRLAIECISMKLEDELTEGLVRDCQPYSSCYPSETSYCSGVSDALAQLTERIFEKYTITLKIK